MPMFSHVPDPDELDQRADEAARLIATTLFPAIYEDNPDHPVPYIYHRAARIVIQAIDEGLV